MCYKKIVCHVHVCELLISSHGFLLRSQVYFLIRIQRPCLDGTDACLNTYSLARCLKSPIFSLLNILIYVWPFFIRLRTNRCREAEMTRMGGTPPSGPFSGLPCRLWRIPTRSGGSPWRSKTKLSPTNAAGGGSMGPLQEVFPRVTSTRPVPEMAGLPNLSSLRGW